jgi:2-polyprenyl-3-methyl-5-hydroxy-6-metoxy-1,4-benzoquinol methylase
MMLNYSNETADVNCGASECPLTLGDHSNSHGWQMLSCSKCGQLRIPPEHLVHSTVEPDAVGAIGLAMKVLFHMRLTWLRGVVSGLQMKGTKWLDAGCGDGQFLEFLASRGYTSCVGVEPDQLRAFNARKRGVRVFSSVPEVRKEIGSQSFDVITLWHVLEHLNSPAELLKEYSQYLSPRGVFLLQVPNHGGAQTGLLGKWSAYPDYGRHIWFHNRQLKEWLASVLPGFKVERVRDLNFEYEIFGWVESLSSAIMRETNFMLRTLKKRRGTRFEKNLAILFAVLFLPAAALLSVVSLMSGFGSTLTFKIERGSL